MPRNKIHMSICRINKILTGATAFQASAGGISGAEVSSWIVFRGTRDQVKKALDLTNSVQGEPPYSE
ncbi:MAG: hypothetical protein A4E68_01128 [Syntrophaceae bacterium PtaB.Bin095]|nr:MAG: hypothetical protein A4E68_01128 [Syntrophaceae bacterium PtaB.Bin095]